MGFVDVKATRWSVADVYSGHTGQQCSKWEIKLLDVSKCLLNKQTQKYLITKTNPWLFS